MSFYGGLNLFNGCNIFVGGLGTYSCIYQIMPFKAPLDADYFQFFFYPCYHETIHQVILVPVSSGIHRISFILVGGSFIGRILVTIPVVWRNAPNCGGIGCLKSCRLLEVRRIQDSCTVDRLFWNMKMESLSE